MKIIREVDNLRSCSLSLFTDDLVLLRGLLLKEKSC